MPLDTLGTFFYFLILAILYGSPLILLVLVFRYRQGKLFNGIASVIIGVPLIALILMIGFRLDIAQLGFEQDRQEQKLDTTFDRTQEVSKFVGSKVESFDLTGYTYSRYRFKFNEGLLELTVPPGNVTSIAELKYLAEPYTDPHTGTEQNTAQLWLLGANAQYQPVGNNRNQYFEEHLNVPVPTDDIIFMRLYPGSNSSVKYWAEDANGKMGWRYQMLAVDWSSLKPGR